MVFKTDLQALILGVLQHADLHGYEISRRIAQVDPSALKVGESQLYPALHRLENEGFVSALWIPQEGKPARKVYTITERGTRELDKKRQAWSEYVKAVGMLLDSKPGDANA